MKLRSTMICLLASILFLFTVVPVQAVQIWGTDATTSGELIGGTRTSPDVYGVHGTENWGSGGFTINWDIEQVTIGTDNVWKYSYTILTTRKDISNFILEVTEDEESFVVYDHDDSTVPVIDEDSLKTWNLSPDTPNSIYGVKFDYGGESGTTYTLFTDRGPTWGVFFRRRWKQP